MKKKVFLTVAAALTVLATLLVVSGIFSVSAEPVSGTCGENLTWTFDPDTGELAITGTGEMDDYEFGNDSDTYSSPWSGLRNEIVKVTIGEGVTSIGNNAFSICEIMTSVEIPDSVTSIGNMAFRSCFSLTSVEIPDSVTSIGNSAFDWCISLTSVEIPDSVESIGDYAFCWCGSLTSVMITGNGVTSIGGDAFSQCSSLTNATIGNGVESIGAYAFQQCDNLMSVTIIGNGAMSIGDCAFYQCSSLTNATIGNGVKSIGESAFYECSSLTSVEISNSVTSIGDSAFCNSGLTSVEIPDSVTSIGDSVFKYCTGLKTVSIGKGVTSISDSAFIGCYRLTSLEIPDNVTSIGDNAFNGCSGLTSVEIPNSVTSIGEWAFRGCSGLTSLKISDRITSIEVGVFERCTGLTSVKIPDSVTSIGDNAFSDCSGLTSVEIPDSVTSIGGNAFARCSSLTSMEIPDSVTNIGIYAFWSAGLTNVEIPSSVTNIGWGAFYYCTSLTSVYVDSAEIAKQLTSTESCGYLIEYAETVYINTAITDIPEYITTTFPYTDTVEHNGIFYNSYSKNAPTVPDPTEPDPSEPEIKEMPVLTITTDKDRYNYGDTIKVTVTITYPDGTTDAALEAFYADVYTEFRFAKASSNWWGNAFDGPIYDCDNEYGTTLTAVFTMDQYRYGEGEYVIGILQYYEGDDWDYDYNLLLEGSVNIYYTAQDETSKVITGSDLVIEGNDIVIDAKGKDSAVLDLDSVRKTLKDVLQSGDTSTTLEIRLSGGTVTLNYEAIKTLFEAAESGYRMTITGKSIDKGDLNEDQLKALEGEDVAACISLEVWITSWDYDIDDEVNTQFTDFGDGNVTVAIPFELSDGVDAKDVKVAYVADDGTITAMPTTYEDGALVFETTHFSNYVALINSEIADPGDNDPTDPGKDDPTDPGKDDPADPDTGDVSSPKTGDNSYLILWTLLLVIGAAGMVVFARKRGTVR